MLIKSVLKKVFRALFKYKKKKDDKNIFIHTSAIIEDTAKIEIKGKGSIKIGKDSYIGHGVYIATYGGQIEIGEKCSINAYTIIYGHGNTKIGNSVLIAGHCMLIPNHHKYIDKDRSIIEQGCQAQPIIIEDDVWLAHNVTVTMGVTIAKGCVVGAQSVVKQDTEPYGVYVGTPARYIKSRS